MQPLPILRKLLAFRLLAVATLAGCGWGDELEKAVISGQVTYQGQPIEDGLIRFIPVHGTKGPATFGTIRGGSYTAEARGGIPVGVLRVEVAAYRRIPGAKPYTKEQAEENRGIVAGDYPKEQFLPPEHNTNSTLEVTIESGRKTVTKDFDLR